MSGSIRKPPLTVFLVSSLASLFFLVSYGSQAFEEGFTTGRIVRLVIWGLILIVSITVLVRARMVRKESS